MTRTMMTSEPSESNEEATEIVWDAGFFWEWFGLPIVLAPFVSAFVGWGLKNSELVFTSLTLCVLAYLYFVWIRRSRADMSGRSRTRITRSKLELVQPMKNKRQVFYYDEIERMSLSECDGNQYLKLAFQDGTSPDKSPILLLPSPILSCRASGERARKHLVRRSYCCASAVFLRAPTSYTV